MAKFFKKIWYLSEDKHVMVSKEEPKDPFKPQNYNFVNFGLATDASDARGVLGELPGAKLIIKTTQHEKGIRLLWDLMDAQSTPPSLLNDLKLTVAFAGKTSKCLVWLRSHSLLS